MLNRAAWSGLAAARVLLRLLLDAFVPHGAVIIGLDDTIERRWGTGIGARGIYRDPVRSSHGHFVKASGLRWLSVMLLAPIPWAGRVWALPFLTVLAPSERYARARPAAQEAQRTGRGSWFCRRGALAGRAERRRRRQQLRALESCCAPVSHSGTSSPGCGSMLASMSRRRPAVLGTIGRPRTKGARLPTLTEVPADEGTPWRRVVPGWYGEGDRVEIASGTALWHHPGSRCADPLGAGA